MKRLENQKGVTLPEVLISIFILFSLFVGTMYTLLKCVESSEVSRNSSMAVTAVRNKIAEIESSTYSMIVPTYDHVTFTENNFNGIGVTYVNNSDPDLLRVKAVFCWAEKNRRIIGEDLDLDGILDTGEDSDGNGEIDSMVSIVTLIDNI